MEGWLISIEQVKSLLISGPYASASQFLILFILASVALLVVIRIRTDSAYVTSVRWLAVETLVASLFFFGILKLLFVIMGVFVTPFSVRSILKAIAALGGIYILYYLSFAVVAIMNHYTKALMSLTDKHVYFFETDYRLILRCCAISMIGVSTIVRSL